ncbi:cupredoxin domain-containing protein [Halalkalibacter urbisdiaboli]|uniref:cupredoxin domain-containing protein n=1 Tax=Halalkalibacter urbisdiaboli TaxID=1960589 RepID=UPI000B42F2D0|nr:cupredoxin domain-containing protein [Halalkalibacter urbisdiaboli]
MKFIIIKKLWLVVAALGVTLGIGAFIFTSEPASIPVIGSEKEFELHMVTGEFKTKTEDGKEIEAYRWDPGSIHIPKGENVKLRIFGVNGMEHPFVIEGTDIKGSVKKGEETVVQLNFDEAGTYRLICTAHASIENNGPMIAYIVVE